MKINDLPDRTIAIEAEQAVIGAMLLDNGAIDRITDLASEHFYRHEHRVIFAEICKQVMAGKRCDVITLFDKVGDQVEDCLRYLNSLQQSTPSASSIRRHADTVIDRALKRSLITLSGEMHEAAANSKEDSYVMAADFAGKLDTIAQKKTSSEPVSIAECLASYADLLDERMTGRIKPIATGFTDLDRRLDGGLDRGTLTIVAARPGMGKSAMGLCVGRNVGEWGSALFLSMEMSKAQVSDRNVAALGKLPISWLKNPQENDKATWDRLTYAFQRATELKFYIDDTTSLNMMEVRSKARSIKRRHGLDLLVIDQLSFLTGGSKDKKTYELVGEYTRGLITIAKELNIAVILLCQLNRECETRPNRRPQMSDLAASGSIEQDAANILFLYRDEIYNPDSMDKGVCEVNIVKQRQGEPGVVPLTYIANQTRFEDFKLPWQPPAMREKPKSRGFD